MPGSRGDFVWLLNTVPSARDLNVFPISCFAVDIRMFPTSVFLCVRVPPLNIQNTQTHTCMGHLHNYTQIRACKTHTGMCKHTYSHCQIKPHACRNTCRRRDRDILLKQKLCMLPADTVEAPQPTGPGAALSACQRPLWMLTSLCHKKR